MIRAAQVKNSAGQRVVGTFYAVHIDEIREEPVGPEEGRVPLVSR